MEIGYISKAKQDPAVILEPSNYIKAANYKISVQRMDMLSTLFDYLMFIFWIGFGLKWLEKTITIQDPSMKSVVYVLAFIIIGYIATLPFDLYKTFVLDKKYGFSNITPKLYLIDTLKSGVLFLIFGSAVIWAISKFIAMGENWWLWGFCFIFLIILIINMIYPTLIAPIFNKFEVLKDENLKEAIEKLLSKAGLKSSGVFTIDASKRDNRLNAYFGGLGKSKRVVLFDTLIEKLNEKELLAVLGHELGHYTHKDILKNIFMMGILMFILFYIFGHLPDILFEAMGIPKAPHTIIAIFLIFAPIVSFFFMPIFGIVSRANEYAADEYGAQSQDAPSLANALQKLANENKSFPKSHPLFIFFYYTHPPLIERLKRLGMKIDEGK
jgi:STE24 endopeptidase